MGVRIKQDNHFFVTIQMQKKIQARPPRVGRTGLECFLRAGDAYTFLPQ
jgi:hypothetical protein